MLRRFEIYGRVREVGDAIELDRLAAAAYSNARIVRINETPSGEAVPLGATVRRASCCL